MSHAETILEYLERFSQGVCDDCISRETAVKPRQQVNQICRQLEGRAKITRRKDPCELCGHPKTVNSILRRPPGPQVGDRRGSCRGPEVSSGGLFIHALWRHLDRFCKALAAKYGISTGKNGLAALISALTDRGIVPMHQANMMHTIRGLRNAHVHEDIRIGTRETAIAEAARDMIRESAEFHEGELGSRTSDAGGVT